MIADSFDINEQQATTYHPFYIHHYGNIFIIFGTSSLYAKYLIVINKFGEDIWVV